MAYVVVTVAEAISARITVFRGFFIKGSLELTLFAPYFFPDRKSKET